MPAFAPSIAWDPKVQRHLEATFGAPQLTAISQALCRPSLATSLRVNSLATTPQEVVRRLQQLLPPSSRQPFVHPAVADAVIVPGAGPHQPNYEACGRREVIINRLAGEAVLKGANVFAPGLLAASPGLAEGDTVAVSVALEQPGRRWCGLNRGARLTPALQRQLDLDWPQRQRLFVGVGRAAAGRVGLFRQQQGLAVELTERVFKIPALQGALRGLVMLQALPCIVAAHALDPQPGWRVLDMCAAPGGKTTMLGQLMRDRGRLVALDRTRSKVQAIESLAADWGLTCVTALVADATQLYQQEAAAGGGAPALPPELAHARESFDAVLLDAPCSALGLRPRLLVDWSLPALEKLAAYQRALLHSAVHVLKPGGVLVFSTCTINPGENEANVRYALDRWPQLLRLEEQPLVRGGPGLVGEAWLSPSEARLVQRFSPAEGADDTMGFFIARFRKAKRRLAGAAAAAAG